MPSKFSTWTCEANGKSCKKTSQARCYHCDKDLCRVHLLEHIQLVQGKTREQLNSFLDRLNESSSKVASLAVSPQILDEPFCQLDRWREAAHQEIDRIAETKRSELTATIKRYRRMFAISKDLRMKKIDSHKEQLAAMLAETDANHEQIANMQSSINQTVNYLTSCETHCINIVPTPANYAVNIRIESSNGRSLFGGDLREFQVTYVRLNGLIRSYPVLTNKDGNIKDLKNSFVEEYAVLNEPSGMIQATDDSLSHQPRADHILPIEVHDHRVQPQYEDDHSLDDIEVHDKIVFYETPYSLIQENNPRILMSCSFQHSTRREPIGLPIYFDVPRQNCKGQDVSDAMHDTLARFLPIDSKDGQQLFEAIVKYQVNNRVTSRKLREVLSDEIDLLNEHTCLTVGVSAQMVQAFQNIDGSSTETLFNLLNWK